MDVVGAAVEAAVGDLADADGSVEGAQEEEEEEIKGGVGVVVDEKGTMLYYREPGLVAQKKRGEGSAEPPDDPAEALAQRRRNKLTLLGHNDVTNAVKKARQQHIKAVARLFPREGDDSRPIWRDPYVLVALRAQNIEQKMSLFFCPQLHQFDLVLASDLHRRRDRGEIFITVIRHLSLLPRSKRERELEKERAELEARLTDEKKELEELLRERERLFGVLAGEETELATIGVAEQEAEAKRKKKKTLAEYLSKKRRKHKGGRTDGGWHDEDRPDEREGLVARALRMNDLFHDEEECLYESITTSFVVKTEEEHAVALEESPAHRHKRCVQFFERLGRHALELGGGDDAAEMPEPPVNVSKTHLSFLRKVVGKWEEGEESRAGDRALSEGASVGPRMAEETGKWDYEHGRTRGEVWRLPAMPPIGGGRPEDDLMEELGAGACSVSGDQQPDPRGYPSGRISSSDSGSSSATTVDPDTRDNFLTLFNKLALKQNLTDGAYFADHSSGGCAKPFSEEWLLALQRMADQSFRKGIPGTDTRPFEYRLADFFSAPFREKFGHAAMAKKVRDFILNYQEQGRLGTNRMLGRDVRVLEEGFGPMIPPLRDGACGPGLSPPFRFFADGPPAGAIRDAEEAIDEPAFGGPVGVVSTEQSGTLSSIIGLARQLVADEDTALRLRFRKGDVVVLKGRALFADEVSGLGGKDAVKEGAGERNLNLATQKLLEYVLKGR